MSQSGDILRRCLATSTHENAPPEASLLYLLNNVAHFVVPTLCQALGIVRKPLFSLTIIDKSNGSVRIDDQVRSNHG
jgi:hypothetical protein